MNNPLEDISQTVRKAIQDGVFPGGVLLVHHQGEVRLHKAFGHASVIPQKRAMNRDTCFDLASLTKPVATTTLLMQLIARGKVSLEDRLSRFLPEDLPEDKQAITLYHLLTHSSGLPDYRPFYRDYSPQPEAPGTTGVARAHRDALIKSILQEPLVYSPGSRSQYSDLGFILLGEVIEKVCTTTLDKVCAEWIFQPLGMRDTGFLPPEGPDFAAMEDCPWREQVMVCQVHDEHAWLMGGVSGHAGLFGTAGDLHRFLEVLSRCLAGDHNFLPAGLVRQFLTRQSGIPGSSWALGWMTPSIPSSAGQYFSPASFGHLGYTGSSIWVDPTIDLMVILLTNRVHPTRKNNQIQAFRPRLHEVVCQALRPRHE